ncbi:hypothetical protein R1sor_024821 [Riccia sorocarpa]|uniref:E2F/DP family winged-helix DNA-binding domain-containing protein n=1 Tax=Riccia sorocarpa TaxID=122646 RepID=A0ABD3GUS8_9MARC
MTRKRGKQKLQRCKDLPATLGVITSEIQSDTSALQGNKSELKWCLDLAAGKCRKDESDDEFTLLVNQLLPASDVPTTGNIDEFFSSLEKELEDNEWPITPSAQITDCPNDNAEDSPTDAVDLPPSLQAPNMSASSGVGSILFASKVTHDFLLLDEIVIQKVRQKRETTYDEIADEVVADHEYMEMKGPSSSSGGGKLSDAAVKNIKRRVYDCLNVFNEIKLIYKDPQTRRITWLSEETVLKEVPRTTNLSKLQEKKLKLQNSLKKKGAILRKYEDEVEGLQNLIGRNKKGFHDAGQLPEAHLMLPFTLLEISNQDHSMVDWKLTDDREVLQVESNRLTLAQITKQT